MARKYRVEGLHYWAIISDENEFFHVSCKKCPYLRREVTVLSSIDGMKRKIKEAKDLGYQQR